MPVITTDIDLNFPFSSPTQVKHVFKSYPSGVRFVEFTHGGKDTKFWAGHYGVKMTNSGVFVGKKRSNRKKRVSAQKSSAS